MRGHEQKMDGGMAGQDAILIFSPNPPGGRGIIIITEVLGLFRVKL